MSKDEYSHLYDYNESTSERPVTAIANQIALNAILAGSTQVAVPAKPGNVHRYHDFQNTKMEHYLSSAISLHEPIYQIASRGVMVNRELIDFDEVDMGWIISQAAKQGTKWHHADLSNLGMLFLLSPIAAASGYLISRDKINDNDAIDIKSIPDIALEFVENTTPEDSVNVVTLLYKLNSQIYPSSDSSGVSLPDIVSDILEDEINLLDFYKSIKHKNYLFEEICSNYTISFGHGLSAFIEAINEHHPMTYAISHTYLTILSLQPDSHVFLKYGRQAAIKIQQEAKKIIGAGGYLTSKGRELTLNLDNELRTMNNEITPGTTADLTANVTFLATLLNIRP